MAKIINIKNPSELASIHNLIHDCFFDVDDIAFDSSTSVLTFRFRRPTSQNKRLSWKDFVYSSKQSPAVEAYLRVHHVERYSINDTEKVGLYDFNVLDYNPSAKCIMVLTGIPIDIRIVVRDFEISLEETDNVIEHR